MSTKESMTEAQAVPVEAPAYADPGARASALVERLNAEEGPDEEEGGEGEQEAPAPSEAPPEAPLAASDKSAERMARLEGIRERAKAEQHERDQRAAAKREREEALSAKSRVETLEKELAEATALREALKDPARFLEIAKEHGVPADVLGQYLTESMNDPAAHAAKVARKSIDPTIAALEAKNAALEAKLDAIVEESKKEKAHAQRQADADFFVEQVKALANEAPLTHSYLREIGSEKFIAEVETLARTLPQGIGLQAIIDEIETRIEAQVGLLGRLVPSATGTTAPPSPSSTRNRATATANTLSNRAAQERASVAEEVDPSTLTLEERGALLKRKLSA